MDFGQALEKVLEWEGPYDCDEDDPGGETCFGITRKYQGGWGGWSFVEALLSKGVPKEQWKIDQMLMSYVAAYYKQTWDALCCDLLPAAIRGMVFGGAINQGPERMAKWVQEALLESGRPVEIDGRIGPDTARGCYSTPDHVMLAKLFMKRTKAYLVTCEKRPKAKKYLFGWLSRLNGGA